MNADLLGDAVGIGGCRGWALERTQDAEAGGSPQILGAASRGSLRTGP